MLHLLFLNMLLKYLALSAILLAVIIALAWKRQRGKGFLCTALLLSLVAGMADQAVFLLKGRGLIGQYSMAGQMLVSLIATGYVISGILLVLFVIFVRRTSAANESGDRNVLCEARAISLLTLAFSFRGRIGRRTFWLVYVCLMLANILVGLFARAALDFRTTVPVVTGVSASFLWSLICVWAALALQVKRWHDRDKSGWMVLINFIPVIGLVWALIELGFLPGTEGPNRYGVGRLDDGRDGYGASEGDKPAAEAEVVASPLLQRATRGRLRLWAVGVCAAFVVAVVLGLFVVWMQDLQRVRGFKREAQAAMDQVRRAIASSIATLDPSRAERPPRELYRIMQELDEAEAFTYSVLYLPDPSDEQILWRYRGKYRHIPYEEDSPRFHSWAGFQKIDIVSELERAMRKALSGDAADLNEFNRRSKASRQSVIVGGHGEPLAILRLTIDGLGGDERKIK